MGDVRCRSCCSRPGIQGQKQALGGVGGAPRHQLCNRQHGPGCRDVAPCNRVVTCKGWGVEYLHLNLQQRVDSGLGNITLCSLKYERSQKNRQSSSDVSGLAITMLPYRPQKRERPGPDGHLHLSPVAQLSRMVRAALALAALSFSRARSSLALPEDQDSEPKSKLLRSESPGGS